MTHTNKIQQLFDNRVKARQGGGEARIRFMAEKEAAYMTNRGMS